MKIILGDCTVQLKAKIRSNYKKLKCIPQAINLHFSDAYM
jgi:hypothetical protein